MANKVDKHVVQMEFDNAAFEKKVATTRTSIKNLKNDLKFDGNTGNLSAFEKGISSLTNKIKSSSKETASSMKTLQTSMNDIDFKKLSSNIDTIASRFSTMGIAGVTAIQRITNSVLDFGKNIASSTLGQIISGGKQRALNLEQAQFQIQGLGVDWKSTANEFGKSLFSQIDEAVTGTAYGLDAAAKVAGQLLASNLKAGSQEMQNALSGISGVAAMTNSSYEEIGRIFTTIAGNGRIMGEQLNQFASRGLNVAAKLAEAYGVDEAALREMVSKGQVDFKTFARVMNEAFGKQATMANNTYTGALSNVRAALSRIGAEVQTPYLENMRQTFVALIPVLNGVKNILGPVFDITKKGMAFLRTYAIGTLEKLAYLTEDGLKLTGLQKVGAQIKKIIDLFYGTDKIPGTNTALTNIEESFKTIIGIITNTAKSIKTILTPAFQGISQAAFKGLNPIRVVTSKIRHGLIKLKNYLEDLGAIIDTSLNRGGTLKNVTYVITLSLKALAKILGVVVKIAGELIKVGAVLLGVAMRIINPFAKLVIKIYDTFIASELLYEIFKPMVTSFKKLKNTISELANTFKKFFLVGLKPVNNEAKTTQSIWTSVVNVITKALTKLAEAATWCFDKLRTLLDNNQGSLYKFGFNFGKTIRSVINWIKNFVTSWDGIRGFFHAIIDNFKKFKQGVSETIDSFKDIKTKGVEQFTLNLKSSLGPLQAIGRFFVTLWELLKSIFSKIAPLIKSFTTVLFDAFSNIALMLKNGVDNLTPSDSMSLLTGGGAVALIMLMLKKVEKIIKEAKSLTNALDELTGIKSFFASLTDYAKQLKKNKSAEALKSFATAVLEIAIAVMLLASIEPSKLIAPMLIISVLIAELGGLFQTMLKGGDKMYSGVAIISSAIVKMAGAVLILAIAVKSLVGLPKRQLLIASTVISGLLWEMVGVMKALAGAKQADASIVKLSISLIAMAVAVKIMAASIKALSDVNPGNVLAASFGLMLVISAMAGGLYIMAKSSDGIIKASLAFIVLAFGLKQLSGAIGYLAQFKPTNVIAASIAISIIVFALSKLISISTKDFFNISKSIKGIAVSLALLAGAFYLFSFVKPEDMEEAALALAGVLAALIIMSIVSKRVDSSALFDIGIALTGIGIAMAGIGAAAALMENVSWETMAKAGVALVVLLGSIILLGKLKLNYSDMSQMALAMVALAGSLLVMGLALGIFTGIPIIAIVKGLGTLAIALGVLIAATYALQKSHNIDNLQKLAIAFAMIGGAMALFGVGLTLFAASLPALALGVGSLKIIVLGILGIIVAAAPMITKALNALFAALVQSIKDSLPLLKSALVDVAVNALDFIYGVLPQLGKTLDKFLEVVWPLIVEWVPKLVDGLVDIIINVIEGLAKRTPDLVQAIGHFFKNLLGAIKDVFNVSFNEETMKGLLIGLTIFTACLVAIAIAGKIAQQSLLGMVALIAVVGLVVVAILVLTSIDTDTFLKVTLGLSAALLSLSLCLLLISVMPLPAALMGIVGLVALIATMTAVTYALGKDPAVLENLEAGIKVLSLVGQAIGEFLGQIIGTMMSALSEALPTIADNLSLFMIKLQPFIIGLKMINDTMLESALKLCGVIIAFTAAELLQGIASFLGGGKSIAQFGQELVEFAPSLVEFGNIIKDADPAAITLGALAAKAIAEFAAAIPNHGGLLGGIVGENDMGVWSEQLPEVARGLVTFNNIVRTANWDQDKLDIACKCGIEIATMASKLPNEGGLLGGVVGENSMSIIAEELEPFAKGLVTFNNVVRTATWDEDKLDIACKVGIAIAEMAKELPNEGGIWGGIVGENSMSVIAPELEEFAKGLVTFNNVVRTANWDYEAVDKAVLIAQAIVGMAKEIPNEGGFVSFWTGDNTLSMFGEQIAEFGIKLTDFSDNIADVRFGRVTTATEALRDIIAACKGVRGFNTGDLKAFAEGLKALGEADVQGFLDSFYEADDKVELAVTHVLELALSKMHNTDVDATFKSAGSGLATSIIQGITQNKKNSIDAVEQLALDMVSGFAYDKYYEDIWAIGQNFCAGIASGIYMNAWQIENAATEVADESLVTPTKNALQERSPSRIAIEAGRFWDEGLAGGMKKYAYTVSEASRYVSDEVISYISDVQNAIDTTDFDSLEPSVRPVVDLSGVRSGAGNASRIMRGAATYSISSAIAKDRAEFNKRSNTIKVEATSKDVVEAVNKLESHIDDLGDRISGMELRMDGKATVGVLRDPMDKALGRKASKNSGGVRTGRLVQR